MERESFVFYKSFFEALSCLDKDAKADCFDAIAQYALYGEVPDISGAAKAVFVSVKPQIDANNRRYANGCKGGKPKANQSVTKPKPKRNQSVTKTEPNPNQSVTKAEPNVNVNDNVNENDNDNVNENVNENEKKYTYGENKKVSLTNREYERLVNDYGVDLTKRAIEFLDGYIVDQNYKSKSNYQAIRRWVIKAVKERAPTQQPVHDDFFSNIWGDTG